MNLPDGKVRSPQASEWPPLLVIVLTLTLLTATMVSLNTYVGSYVQHITGSSSTKDSGYYAGWIGSSFLIGRLATSYCWGVFADRFGRKPVFIIGTISIAVCSVGFGMSTSFTEAVTWRFLLGITTSVWSVARILIPEIMQPERVVIGMGFMPGSKAIGTIIGPLCGGLLVQPAERWPSFFSRTGLFGRFPFLLPNLFLALLSMVTLPLVLVFLPETLITSDKREGRASSRSSLEDYSSTLAGDSKLEEPTRTRRLSSPSVQSDPAVTRKVRSRRYTLASTVAPASNAALLHIFDGPVESSEVHHDAHEEDDEVHEVDDEEGCLRPLVAGVVKSCRDDEGDSTRCAPCCSSCQRSACTAEADQVDPRLCGANGLLTSRYVRLLLVLEALNAVLGWTGIGMLVFQFVVFPLLCRTIGIMPLLQITGVMGFLVMVITPDIQRMSGRDSVLVAVLLLMTLNINGSVLTTALTLSITNAVPSQNRGQFTGIFTLVESFGRAFSPAAFGILLAWSIQRSSSPCGADDDIETSASTTNHGHSLVDYHLVFVIESLFMIVIVVIGWRTFTLEKITLPIEKREQRLRSVETELVTRRATCAVP